jgi:hypothetical protein
MPVHARLATLSNHLATSPSPVAAEGSALKVSVNTDKVGAARTTSRRTCTAAALTRQRPRRNSTTDPLSAALGPRCR